MRHLKSVLAVLTFFLTISTYAIPASSYRGVTDSSVSREIEKMLSDSQLGIEEEFTVTVIFRVTEDKRIDIYSISSSDEKVNSFLQKRLHKRKLHGKGCFSEKVYVLPVKVEAVR